MCHRSIPSLRAGKRRYTHNIFDPGGPGWHWIRSAKFTVGTMSRATRDRGSRRAQEGTAVSSGESSAATPQPALNPEDLTLAAVDWTRPKLERTLSLTPPRLSRLRQWSSATLPTKRRLSKPRSHPVRAYRTSFSQPSALPYWKSERCLAAVMRSSNCWAWAAWARSTKRATNEVDRTVGLKIIRPDLPANPAILARFKQELVLARQITHRNIIRIYDLNGAEGVKFITMEFIEGEDLRTSTRQSRCRPEKAITILAPGVWGLQAAHNEGVIHRDLKPSNIMRGRLGPRGDHGLRAGENRPGRRDDADRHDDWDDGIHVAGAGDGFRSGCALRPIFTMGAPDLYELLTRQYSVPGGERNCQPGKANAGTSGPVIRC